MDEVPRVKCEDITSEVFQKYQDDGFRLVFQEYVMEHDLGELPDVESTVPVGLQSWSQPLENEFYEVYVSSFRDRPGFPGWSREKWVDWISSDSSFRPDLSHLASVQDRAVGFIASDDASQSQGYIIQVGVVPEWRRNGIAQTLTTKVLEQFRREGKDSTVLHVNANNAPAKHLYEQLGFRVVRTRGEFARQS